MRSFIVTSESKLDHVNRDQNGDERKKRDRDVIEEGARCEVKKLGNPFQHSAEGFHKSENAYNKSFDAVYQEIDSIKYLFQSITYLQVREAR